MSNNIIVTPQPKVIVRSSVAPSIQILPTMVNPVYGLNTSANNTVANVTLSSSLGVSNTVQFVGNGAVTVSANSTTITISADAGSASEYTLLPVANTTTGANVRLSSGDNVNTDVKLVGSGIVNVQSNSTAVIISAPAPTDNNTTYDLTLAAANTTVANLQLVGSDATTDVIRVTGNGIVNVISNATHIVVSAPAPPADTDTTYTLTAPANVSIANITLTSSGSAVNNVRITGAGSVTVAANSTNGITVTGVDTDTTYSLATLANTTAGSNVRLTSVGNVNTDVKIIGSGLVNVQSNTTVITITGATPTDNNTVYDLSLAAANTTVANLQLVGNDATTDVVRFTGNGAVNIISNTTHIIVSAPVVTDTDTTYSLSTLANTTAGSNVRLTSAGNVNTDVRLVGTGLVNIQSNTTAITITAAAPSVNTYTLTAPANTTSANVTLTASGGAVNNVRITGAGSVTVAANSTNGITITGVDTDNNTTYDLTLAAANTTVANLQLVGSDVTTDVIRVTGNGAVNVISNATHIIVSAPVVTDTDTTYSLSTLANTTAGSNVRLTSAGNVNTDVRIMGSGLVNVQSNSTVITINGATPTDNNTVYDLTLAAANTTVANLQLVGNDATSDVVRFTGNGAVNVISNATHIIVSAPVVVDTDTTYSISTLANTTAGSNVRLTSAGNVNTDVKLIGAGTVNIQSNSTVITITGSGGGGGSPSGSNTTIQYNDSGAFNGSDGFTYNETSNNVLIANTLTTGNSTINATTNAIATVFNGTASPVIRSTNTEIIIEQTGDQYGRTFLTLQNRNGLNGALFGQAGSVELVEFGFQANSTVTKTIRTEARAGSQLAGSSGEMQFGVTGNPSLVVGDAKILIARGDLQVGNSTVNIAFTNTTMTVSNSTATANITSIGLAVGTTIANATVVQAANLTSTAGIGGATITATTTISTGANVISNTTAMFVGNSTVNSTQQQTAFNLANSTVSSNLQTGQLNIGANVAVNTTRIHVGNSTANATANSILLQVINSTATANITPLGLAVGTTIANATVVQAANLNSTAGINGVTLNVTTTAAVGANVVANTTAMFVGNSTANSTQLSTQIQVANSTGTTTITPISVVTGVSTVNSTTMAVGANNISNTTAVYVGNSTVNAVHNQVTFLVANSTVYTNVQIGVVTIGNSTVNAVANSTAVKLSNSTVNTTFTLPNTSQYGATNAFLHANGQWVNVAAGGGDTYTLSTLANTTAGSNVRLSSSGNVNTDVKIIGTGSVNIQSNSTVITINGAAGAAAAGGSNTQIQFNDSTVIAGSAGLTFDKTSNNMTLANTFFTDTFLCNVGQGNYIVAGANVTLDGTTVGAVSIGTGLTTLIIPTYMQMPTQNVLSVTTADANTARLAIYNGAMTRLAVIDQWGEEDFMQSSFGQKSIAMSHAVAAGTTPSVFGAAIANTLAYTARTPASTNYYTASKRVGIASNTTAGTSAEHRASSLFLTRGNSSSSGGFLFEIKFGISVISTNYRFFCGLKNTTSVLSNGNPSAQTNILGVGIDSTQSNLHIMHNDASSPATTIDLGSNFPTNAGNTYIYMARFWCPPNANFINYNIRRLDVDFSAQGSLTTNIPGVTEFLAPRVWVNNGSDAATACIDFMSWYCETTI